MQANRLSPSGSDKTTGLAAILNGLAGLLMLGVVVGLIGLTTSANSDKLAEMAITDPWPLIAQDILKILAGLTALVLIRGLYVRFKDTNPGWMKWGSLCGLAAAACLFANALVSLYLVLAASATDLPADGTISALRTAILVLGIGAVVLNGFWYIAVSRGVLKRSEFPAAFGYLGIGVGILSLLPPLALLVLLLGTVWSFWLGWLLWR